MAITPETTPPAYDEHSITVLHGLDPVRKRPGMYIGDTDDGSGLHRMIYEIVDNAIEESLAGKCDTITVTLNPDQSCTVGFNGAGLPVRAYRQGVTAAEATPTDSMNGNTFDPISYGLPGGSHSFGLVVVNALSSRFDVRVFRGESEWFAWFHDGLSEAPLAEVGAASPRFWKAANEEFAIGTEITFVPSTTIFSNTEFDFSTLVRYLRELTFLNSHVTVLLSDLRKLEPKIIRFNSASRTSALRARSSAFARPVDTL